MDGLICGVQRWRLRTGNKRGVGSEVNEEMILMVIRMLLEMGLDLH